MGRALASRLLEGGHQLIVWNRTKGKAAEIISAGAHQADTIAEATASAEVIVTSLANDDAVRDVALGPQGVHASIGPGAIYVDTSTISPRLSGELEKRFARFVHMPILGSPVAVREGRATYLVGGNPAVVSDLSPVLAALSGRILRYDHAPLAAAGKLANNVMLLSGIVSLAEAFTVARSGGLTDDQLRELLGDSPMVAPGIKNRFEGVLTGRHEPWWSVQLGAKDARLAVDTAKDAGVELPLTRVVHDILAAAASAGLSDDDVSAIARCYRANQATADA
jgi:3-hydroxyisobutyrate dehydrogenase